MQFATVIFGVFGCALGIVLGWLVGNRASGKVVAASEVELRTKNELLKEMREDIASLREQLDDERDNHAATRALLAGVNAKAESELDSAKEQVSALLQVEQRLKDTFQSVSYTHLRAHETGRNLV